LTGEPVSSTMNTGSGDGTHQKKRRAFTAKGMTPIEKNIIVVDENGTVFEPTWLKRANGLVKKGRARWLDERTICLACPPEQTEDNRMDINMQTETVTAETTAADTQQPEPRQGGLTLEGLLDRMDAIRQEMLSMKELALAMETIANQGGEDDAGHIAEATSQAFIARETTCQQQLRFLEQVYRDRFSAPSDEERTARIRMILDKLNDVTSTFDYSGEDGQGNVEALRVVTAFYNDLLKKA